MSFLLNVSPLSLLSLCSSLSFDHMFLFWLKTGDHSSPALIKHTLIVGQWQLQGKETREGDQLPWERWKKTKEEERGHREGGRGSRQRDRKQRGREKAVVAKSQLSCQMGRAPYLGNKRSHSLLRTPDSPVLVHFFNNMWPFFHSTEDWWKLCVIAAELQGW